MNTFITPEILSASLRSQREGNNLSNWRFKHLYLYYMTKNNFGIELILVFKCGRQNLQLCATQYL
ncbi:hypothetical protein XOCgx_4491 [Xanthomonas oryzae pv. oryzicola]|nr:hypothetical protein XOCgx_4491 [Xanthomonas oryzae pv. oryzicola]